MACFACMQTIKFTFYLKLHGRYHAFSVLPEIMKYWPKELNDEFIPENALGQGEL